MPNGNIGLLYEVGLVEEDWKDKGIVFVSIHPDDLFKPDTLLDNLNLE